MTTPQLDFALAAPITRGATFSADRRYRYALWRIWGDAPTRLVVIGLNPSTADAFVDDPTIRRCIAFAKREGKAGLIMLNLFALRATDPRVMQADRAPIGPDNDDALRQFRYLSDVFTIVAAWGANAHPAFPARAHNVCRLFGGPLYCFGTTKSGAPKHPLYLRADTPLQPFGGAA